MGVPQSSGCGGSHTAAVCGLPWLQLEVRQYACASPAARVTARQAAAVVTTRAMVRSLLLILRLLGPLDGRHCIFDRRAEQDVARRDGGPEPPHEHPDVGA